MLSAAASVLAKAASAAALLISVPMTLHYLGAERYGLWVTISAFVSMLSFADLGIGNGLMTAIAGADGSGDRRRIKEYISTGYAVLSMIALLLLALFLCAYPWIDWSALFNVSGADARREAGPAILAFAVIFALSIPSGVVQRAQIGLQQGFAASLWQCAASLVSIVGLLAAIACEAGLPLLVLAFLGGPLVSAWANSILFFNRSERDLLPDRGLIRRGLVREIVGTGSQFLILQIVVATAYASNSLIIAQVLGAEAVAGFAVPERLFSLIVVIVTVMLSPLWPAFSEALSRGDDQWIRRTLWRALTLSAVLAAFLSFALVIIGDRVLALWVGDAVRPTMSLLVGFALWRIFEAAGATISVFLNGTGGLLFQTLVQVSFAVAVILGKILAARHAGVEGLVWATVAIYGVFVIAPYSVYVARWSVRHGAAAERRFGGRA